MHDGLTRRELAGLMIGAPFVAAAGTASAAPEPRMTIDGVNGLLVAAKPQLGIPGVVAFAADRNGVIYRGAFGTADLATNRPMTEDAIFRIASMTKPVTSLAAMQLV